MGQHPLPPRESQVWQAGPWHPRGLVQSPGSPQASPPRRQEPGHLGQAVGE